VSCRATFAHQNHSRWHRYHLKVWRRYARFRFQSLEKFWRFHYWLDSFASVEQAPLPRRRVCNRKISRLSRHFLWTHTMGRLFWRKDLRRCWHGLTQRERSKKHTAWWKPLQIHLSLLRHFELGVGKLKPTKICTNNLASRGKISVVISFSSPHKVFRSLQAVYGVPRRSNRRRLSSFAPNASR